MKNLMNNMKIENKKMRISDAKGRKINSYEFFIASGFLLVVEIVLLAYFLILPFRQEARKMKETLSQYTVMHSEIINSFENFEQKETELEGLYTELQEQKKKLTSTIANEDISFTIGKYAMSHNIQIDSMTFPGSELTTKEKYRAVKEVSLVETDKVVEKNELNKTGNENENLTLQEVQIHFNSEYHTFGQFLKAFEEGEQKIRIKNVSVTRVKEGVLKGIVNLEYVILGTSMEKDLTGVYPSPNFEPKESVFQKYEGYIEEGIDPTILLISSDDDVDPNFYMIVNAAASNDTKVTLGVFPRTETEIYFNANNAVQTKLVITGDENQFQYSYSLGSATKTEKRKLDVVDGKLRMDIITHPRSDDKDKVSILLSVENNTEIPLDIRVRNDDVLQPRFNLGKTTGQVSVQQ